jgi:hypothetical protein
LDAIDHALRPSILSNVSTLFVFQTSAEDADLLRHELDEAVTTTDIVNLDDYNCYVKTQLEHKRLPVMHVVTMPPQPGERAVIAQIGAQMARYTRSISVAESERDRFQEQWYGRERNLLRQLMMQGRTSSKKPDKETKTPGDAATPPVAPAATSSKKSDKETKTPGDATATPAGSTLTSSPETESAPSQSEPAESPEGTFKDPGKNLASDSTLRDHRNDSVLSDNPKDSPDQDEEGKDTGNSGKRVANP